MIKSESTTNNIISCISWLLVIFWMLVIFYLSDQPGAKSNQLSTKLTDKIIVHEDTNKNTNWLEEMNTKVRKSTHALVFFVLSIFIVNAFSRNRTNIYMAFFLAFLITASYAALDEYHQSLVQGRSGLISDVVIDCLGGLFGLAVYALFLKLYAKMKTKKISA